MQTLILAGGLGSRLQKVIRHCPKPMVLIRDKPFLEYLILQLKKYNLTEIVLCIGYLREKIKEYFQDGARWGVYVFQKEVLNLISGGSVSLEKDIFPELIGNRFYGKPHRAYFIDIGVPEDYNKIQKEFWKLKNAYSF